LRLQPALSLFSGTSCAYDEVSQHTEEAMPCPEKIAMDRFITTH
jgi:hypothetical protein